MPDNLIVKKRPFTLPIAPPYTDGHVCNLLEADALNQKWRENVRKNVGVLMEASEKAGEEFTQTEFDAYLEDYAFADRAPQKAGDPIMAEARKLAREAIKSQLKLRGVKPADLAPGQMEELTTALLTERPEYRIEAAHRHHAARAAAVAVAKPTTERVA